MRIGDKALRDLTDRELERELQRRRRGRGQSPGTFKRSEEPVRASRRSSSRRGKGPPGWKVRQWYRNLEIDDGASRDEVELAYVRLSEKYHPDRHDDPNKKRLAIQLAGGLREAYRELISTFQDDP